LLHLIGEARALFQTYWKLAESVVMEREIYILRVWQGSSDLESQPVTLTDTQDGQSCSFADLDKFVVFLKEKLAEPPSARNEVGTTFESNPLWEA
jgi:hypothetical protein